MKTIDGRMRMLGAAWIVLGVGSASAAEPPLKSVMTPQGAMRVVDQPKVVPAESVVVAKPPALDVVAGSAGPVRTIREVSASAARSSAPAVPTLRATTSNGVRVQTLPGADSGTATVATPALKVVDLADRAALEKAMTAPEPLTRYRVVPAR